MRKFLSISLLCLVCCASLASSANAKLFPSLYTTLGTHSFSTEQNIKSNPLFGFKLSLDFEGGKAGNDLSIEGTYNHISTESLVNGESLGVTITRLDILYPLLQKTKWRPFLTVGLGRMIFDGDNNKPQDEDIIAYGAGLKYQLTEYLTLRAEGRHELIFNRDDGNIDNFEYTVGVGYTFGKRKPSKKKPKIIPEPIPEPEPEPEPKVLDDDDLDGIKNPVDRCPGTPAGIKVDASGCAGKTPEKPVALIEEVIPAEEPQPAPVEETPAVVDEPVEAVEPVLAPDNAATEEDVVGEEPEPAIEQEEANPADVVPTLPTVITYPADPKE